MKIKFKGPQMKWTHRAVSIVHGQPRLDTAQLPVFYSLYSSQINSKGQKNSFIFHCKTRNVIYTILLHDLPCLFFAPISLPSRAISFNQVNTVIVCRVPSLSSPITSFLRKESISAAITPTEIRISEDPKIRSKMARASASKVYAEDLDSDGEDGQLVSLMGKMVVERKSKAQEVDHFREELVGQSSVGCSANLGPGNLEAILAMGDRPSFVRMNPRPEARDEEVTSPKRQLETPPATTAAKEPASGPPVEPMDEGGEANASEVRPPRSPVVPPGPPVETSAASADVPEAEEHPVKRRKQQRHSKRKRAADRKKSLQESGVSQEPQGSATQPQQQQRQQPQGAGREDLQVIMRDYQDRQHGRQPPIDARTAIKWKRDAQRSQVRKQKEAANSSAAWKRQGARPKYSGSYPEHQQRGRRADGPSREEEEARTAALASRPTAGPSAPPRGPSRQPSSDGRGATATSGPALSAGARKDTPGLPTSRQDASFVEPQNFSNRTRDVRYPGGVGVRIERAGSPPPPASSPAACPRGGPSTSTPSAAGRKPRPSATPKYPSSWEREKRRWDAIPRSQRAKPGWSQRQGPAYKPSPAPATSRPRETSHQEPRPLSTGVLGGPPGPSRANNPGRNDREFAAMEREQTEKTLLEMKEFSKLQKISYAKMAREQEDREKRLGEKERSLEKKLRDAETLMEEAKRVVDRRDDLIHEVRSDDPDIDYYNSAVERYEERQRAPTTSSRSHTRSWEEIDDDLIDLQGYSDPE